MRARRPSPRSRPATPRSTTRCSPRSRRKLSGCDALMLAQFSTARARDAVANVVRCPVLTSPDSAVLAMRKRLS